MLHKRPIAVVLTAALVLVVLAGCMVLPGKFVSDLALRRDGTFTFHYKGEIVLAALAPGAKPGLGGEADTPVEKFEQQPCTNPETDETHDCTAAEIAQQRAKWNDAQREQKAAKDQEKEQGRKMAQTMMGGIDPEDPKAAEAFAAQLLRQQGYTSVVNKGQGKFLVDYTASGRLDHDFTFPTIERMPMVIPFVSVIRRSDGSVRVDAPAFSTSAANPMIPGLANMGGIPGKGGGKQNGGPPVADGTFTLRTDGQVLANNTDEGPKAEAATGGVRLDWKVDARTAAAPTALIKLAK
jgi:hypothetical protein